MFSNSILTCPACNALGDGVASFTAEEFCVGYKFVSGDADPNLLITLPMRYFRGMSLCFWYWAIHAPRIFEGLGFEPFSTVPRQYHSSISLQNPFFLFVPNASSFFGCCAQPRWSWHKVHVSSARTKIQNARWKLDLFKTPIFLCICIWNALDATRFSTQFSARKCTHSNSCRLLRERNGSVVYIYGTYRSILLLSLICTQSWCLTQPFQDRLRHHFRYPGMH